jgi:peptidoglycan/LPS O-acetylase OafA/YrhL
MTMGAYGLAVDAGPVPVAAAAEPRVAPRRPTSLHIPSLDGLRAISFLIVFMAHSGVSVVLAVPGGFGVTVFFFLSGYLITTLMRVEHESTGRVNVKAFYIRRALRILPPFYLILALACGLTLTHVLPGALEPGPVLAQVLHFSNYWFIAFGSRGAAAGTVPYWSLAVEEHFYLVFPFLFLALNRFLSHRGQARMYWALCAAVCAWRCVLVLWFGVPEDRTYLATDTRFDSILFGCALAMGLNPVLDRPMGSERVWKRAILPAAFALLLFTFIFRAPWFRESIRYSLQGLALTPVFITAIRFPRWLPFRVLNAKAVAFVGVLSFTLYLSHEIAIVALYSWFPAWPPYQIALLAFTIALVFSVVIHQLVEKPSAALRKRRARETSAAAAAAA